MSGKINTSFLFLQRSEIIFNMLFMVSTDGNDRPIVDTRIGIAIKSCTKIERLEINIHPTEEFRRCIQNVKVECLSMRLNPTSRAQTFDKSAA